MTTVSEPGAYGRPPSLGGSRPSTTSGCHQSERSTSRTNVSDRNPTFRKPAPPGKGSVASQCAHVFSATTLQRMTSAAGCRRRRRRRRRRVRLRGGQPCAHSATSFIIPRMVESPMKYTVWFTSRACRSAAVAMGRLHGAA